jgi:hypothetical protein
MNQAGGSVERDTAAAKAIPSIGGDVLRRQRDSVWIEQESMPRALTHLVDYVFRNPRPKRHTNYRQSLAHCIHVAHTTKLA